MTLTGRILCLAAVALMFLADVNATARMFSHFGPAVGYPFAFAALGAWTFYAHWLLGGRRN